MQEDYGGVMQHSSSPADAGKRMQRGKPAPSAADSKTALPPHWDELWGQPRAGNLAQKQLAKLKQLSAELAGHCPLHDRRGLLDSLVGASDIYMHPIHRWFSYKEAFSPNLPAMVLDLLDLDERLIAADFFGGVATTALALQTDSRVDEVRSLEYSPLAVQVGNAKLRWCELNPARLRMHADQLLRYRIDHKAPPPALSAFSDDRIFKPAIVASLQAARHAVTRQTDLQPSERTFFLAGIAAITEASSSAMRDGRALRILRKRSRTRHSLKPSDLPPARRRNPVKVRLEHQWLAMIEDLEAMAEVKANAMATPASHVRGDARRLRAARFEDGDCYFPDASIDVAIYSPPYLNFIDYSEVYKLELWLMGHVESQTAFRRLRLGTLRSHPSVRFGERPAPAPDDHPAVDLYHRLGGWLSEYGSRPDAGRTLRHYFEDMHASFQEQFRVLKSGGVCACVVGNSTFSRRVSEDGERREIWRIPVLTDVILCGLAEKIGFTGIEIWHARDLRPRNVSGGRARESVILMRKSD